MRRALVPLLFALVGCGRANAGAAASPPPSAGLALDCPVPADLGELLEHALGGYDSMLRIGGARWLRPLYCGVSVEIERSAEVHQAWALFDQRDFGEGARFEEVVVRFAAARASYSLSIALAVGHLRASTAKLGALSAIGAIGDRRVLPFVLAYAWNAADATMVDPELRVSLLHALTGLTGRPAPTEAAFDVAQFQKALDGYATFLPRP